MKALIRCQPMAGISTAGCSLATRPSSLPGQNSDLGLEHRLQSSAYGGVVVDEHDPDHRRVSARSIASGLADAALCVSLKRSHDDSLIVVCAPDHGV